MNELLTILICRLNHDLNLTRMKSNSDSQEAQEHSEGRIARTIEEQTAKMPSDAWLWAAFAAIGVSMLFHSQGKREDGLLRTMGCFRYYCSASTTSWLKFSRGVKPHLKSSGDRGPYSEPVSVYLQMSKSLRENRHVA